MGIRMHIGYQGVRARTDDTWASAGLLGRANIFLGQDRNKENQLNGYILCLFSLPSIISEKAANNLMSGRTIKHPWERSSLEEIVDMFYT
jgi:hypothetical protein